MELALQVRSSHAHVDTRLRARTLHIIPLPTCKAIYPSYKFFPKMSAMSCIRASSDHSNWSSRKGLIPESSGSSPLEHMPKNPVPVRINETDQVNNVGRGDSAPLIPNINSSSRKISEIHFGKTRTYENVSRASQFARQVRYDTLEGNEGDENKEIHLSESQLSFSETNKEEEVGVHTDKDLIEFQEQKILGKGVSEGHRDSLKIRRLGMKKEGNKDINPSTAEESSLWWNDNREKNSTVESNKGLIELEELRRIYMGEKEERSVITEPYKLSGRMGSTKSTSTSDDEYRAAQEESQMPYAEEPLDKQKLSTGPISPKNLIEVLIQENTSSGNKLFTFPHVVNPDQEIEIFLNRAISSLKEEPHVFIMGAFNKWKWKSFRKQLEKTNFKGDWWSCNIYIPKEAYKIDFVFFNGGHVYDNNDKKDFCIPVEGGIDESAFEDLLLEEKKKELEKLAAEKAERERKDEEQKRIEADRVADEADKALAKMEVKKRQENFRKVVARAALSVENVWHIKPSEFKGGDLVRLYYNPRSGPLSQSNDLWIHGGYNCWKDGPCIVEKLLLLQEDSGDWWYANVVVPDQALVLDWVFADGPPGNAMMYDNNKFQDFHAVVPTPIPEETYWDEEESQIYKMLQKERRVREEAFRAKIEKMAHMKAQTKQQTMKRFLSSQKHIVYTEPFDVQAGSTVSIIYNPSNTPLNGKSEVWFKCSFNRWTHRLGSLPPQKMTPIGNGNHVKAAVKIPLDAYMMDFVFSEKKDGGIYDNKHGADYHFPVLDGISKPPPLHIVHIAVEMAPVAKVGGLGDVVTSLSRAVQEVGHNVEVILPKYDCMSLSNVKDIQYRRSYVCCGTEVKVWFGEVESLPVYFLEPQNGLFWAGCIYGRPNDGDRFGFFCHAALEFLLQTGSRPDILHCHDWSSAPVSWLFKDHYRHCGIPNARVVFTIHNLEFGGPLIGKAMTFSDKATTVSPSYSREVSKNPLISPHLYKFHGILNGIDPDIWDPFNDKFIPIPYTSENVVEGKRAAKDALQQRLGLKRLDRPVVGIVSRLTHQKGIHLIKHAIWRTLDRSGQVVLLGSAPDPRLQSDFVNLANQLHCSHADSARLCLTYDEPLSHLIYAGADFIIVPSIFEPCGLTQLIAMRYGTIPVVRKTGGLYDTVFDIDHDKERAIMAGLEPNGFSFDGADAGGVDYALNRAISAWYNDRDWFSLLCGQVMEQDWSWNRPALEYIELYHTALK